MLPPSIEFLRFANQLADHARTITLRYFRQPIEVIAKNDASPVTIADRECEAALRQSIHETYPEHAIIGEEHGISGNSDYQWILDPIDGTKSFISGFPIYCTLIALLYRGKPIVSIIDMPALNERFTAAYDQNTTLNGIPIHTNTQTALCEATCYTTSPDMFTAEQSLKVNQLRNHIRLQRFTGDGYCYAMLAAGWIELVVEADMKVYDFLPLILIIEKAGGIITDWQGNPLTLNSHGDILAAASEALHRAALEKLK